MSSSAMDFLQQSGLRPVQFAILSLSSDPRGSCARKRSKAATVNLLHRKRGLVQLRQTADVHGRRRSAARILAEAERCTTAGAAEVMPDHVLVECVRGQILFGAEQPQVLPRHEPQQIALAAAMRAIAFHDLFRVAVHFERDATAMTTALVHYQDLLQLAAPVPDRLSATAALMSCLNADASIRLFSWISIARRVLPFRPALNRPVGSSSAAPLAKVSLTLSLYVSPVQMIPSCVHTATPAGFDGFFHFCSS